jgi:hypothetical protein
VLPDRRALRERKAKLVIPALLVHKVRKGKRAIPELPDLQGMAYHL